MEEKKNLKAMLANARTFPELEALGVKLGYQPGWAKLIYQKRQEKRNKK